METRITNLLGIKHPIICGGMFRVGRAALAAAVSEAGGLGITTSVTQPTPEDLRNEIREIRRRTDKPFGVNINLFPTARPVKTEDYVQVVIEENVPVVETSGQSPEPYMEAFKKHEIFVIHKVPGVRYARTAERIGCDAVSVVGFETGGHPGMEDVGSIVLIPRTVDSVRIPVIAGGGIADGRGLAASLALGAEGVVMGTRFLATRESPVHENVKHWMVSADELQTAIIQRSISSPSRVALNAVAREVLQLEKRGTTLEELLPLISGLRAQQVYFEGNVDAGVWSCGQSVGLVRDVPTVKELIDRIMDEAECTLRALVAL